MADLSRGCPGVGRNPHTPIGTALGVSEGTVRNDQRSGGEKSPPEPDAGPVCDDPPSVTIRTARGDVAVCRPCWHRWRHDDRDGRG